MIDRNLTFNGVSLKDLGLVYSTFSEELPSPKILTASIPGGQDVDFTEALGSIAYGQGKHVLVFLMRGETEADRLAVKRRILALMHGKRSTYQLSWVPTTYTGRATVSVAHRWDKVDVYTITISREPWTTSSETLYMTLLPTTHSNPSRWVGVELPPTDRATVKVAGSVAGNAYVKVGNTSTAQQAYAAGTGGTTFSDVETKGVASYAYAQPSDWWIGQLTKAGNLTVNPEHFTVTQDAETDSDWSVSSHDLRCTKYTSNYQRVTVTVTMEDMQ